MTKKVYKQRYFSVLTKMVFRMKNFNIFGIHQKIQLLGGGRVHEKPI